MCIGTCIIGKVDLMLFRKYAADMLFRIEVIDQPGSFSCAPSASKNCLCEHCSLLHPDKVPPEDRSLAWVNFKVVPVSEYIPWPAKLFNLKTCREKYNRINFSKIFNNH